MQGYRPVWQYCLAALAAWVLFPTHLRATPTIELGTYNLQPNMAGQPIQIFAHGGDSVSGFLFVIQTGDGGYYSSGDTVTGSAAHPYTAPPITSTTGVLNNPLAVNIEPGNSVFTSTNSNAQGPSNGPLQYGGADTYTPSGGTPTATPWVAQLWIVNLSTKVPVAVGGATVGQHQLLATVLIDTTGFFSGSYSLSVVNTNAGDSSFNDANNMGQPLTPIAPDGVINIVPEPSALALIVIGAPLLLLRKRRTASPVDQ